MANTFGEQLKAWRKARNFNQLAASTHLGINQSYYSKIERGAHMPSVDVLRRIAEAIGMSLDQSVLQITEPPARHAAGQGFSRPAPVGALIGGVRTEPGDTLVFAPEPLHRPRAIVIVRYDGRETIGVVADHPTEHEPHFWPFEAGPPVLVAEVSLLGTATALHRPL